MSRELDPWDVGRGGGTMRLDVTVEHLRQLNKESFGHSVKTIGFWTRESQRERNGL